MRRCSLALASAALCFFSSTLWCSAQEAKDKSSQESLPWYNPKKYNPLKLIHRGPQSANDQLAAHGNLEARLTNQLQEQGIMSSGKDLKYVCWTFKELPDCIASLRLSYTSQIAFSCWKWAVTGLKPNPVA